MIDRDQFREQGYVLNRRFFPPEELTRMYEEAKDVFGMQPGDALIFSTFLVHRSGTNKSGSIRWSCQYRYNNLAEPTFVARGFPHPYIYRPQPDLITPKFPAREQVEQVFGSNGNKA